MFQDKKKTGCETPEFRKPTLAPSPKTMHDRITAELQKPLLDKINKFNEAHPLPPTSGSNVVKPNPNYVPPAIVKPNKEPCAYSTPCGWCSKWDKKCDKKIGGEPVSIPTLKSRAQKFIDDIKSGNLPPLDTKDTYGLEKTK